MHFIIEVSLENQPETLQMLTAWGLQPEPASRIPETIDHMVATPLRAAVLASAIAQTDDRASGDGDSSTSFMELAEELLTSNPDIAGKIDQAMQGYSVPPAVTDLLWHEADRMAQTLMALLNTAQTRRLRPAPEARAQQRG